MSTPAAATVAVSRRRHMPRVRLAPGGMIGGVIVIALAAIAVLAPLVAPYDPDAVDMGNGLAGPSLDHLLGTDNLGRDIFSRLVVGTRLSLIGPLIVVTLSTILGVLFGLVGGYFGGLIDGITGRTWDLLLGFPPLLLAIALIAVFRPGFVTAVIAISIIYVPLLARVVRSVVLVEKRKAYVDACRVLGYSRWRTAFRHVLPAAVPTIVAQSTLNFGYALLDLAGLAFLGLGVQPPTADWGVMLAEGRKVLLLSPWEVMSAAIAIAIAVVAFNLVGDSLTQRYADRT